MIRWLSVIFVIIAGLSAWIFFFAGQHAKPKQITTAVLDGYMLEARYTQYDPQGQVHMMLYSPKVTHYAEQNISYLDNPHLLAYSQARVPWTIRADKGMSIHDGEEVKLWGNVLIHQAPQPGYPETTITTSAMTIFPHQSYAETDQPIVIIRPDTQINAVGMQANFKTGVFILTSSVAGSYEPSKTKHH